MKRGADFFKNYSGNNPFGDSQSRNFSDIKVSNEFFPTSTFWSLFNDQHEILLGSRGSGKTFLLKMMRYSMLKKINNQKAKVLVRNKEFIALYVPMHLEFVTELSSSVVSFDRKKHLFYFLFNCLLAESLINETIELLNEIENEIERFEISNKLSKSIYKMWFADERKAININRLEDLITELNYLYFNFDLLNGDVNNIPIVFKRQLCSTLISVKNIITNALMIKEEPTWIVCVDEAEFLDKDIQMFINSVFRSDSNRIALKVATLPYYHTTLDTLDKNVPVSKDNDFSYTIVDMKYNELDFISLTNNLCAQRLSARIDKDSFTINSLEDFLGTIGKDDLIDYYVNEIGNDSASQTIIFENIVNELSPKRQKNYKNYSNKRKTIYDKFAPTFYTREMFKLSKNGNSKPGWYAGANTVRKISQGNPRMFINIMSALFKKSCKTQLTAKAQHEVLIKYSSEFCDASQAIEKYGDSVYDNLQKISNYLHYKTHCNYLISVGHSFVINFDENEFESNLGWLQRAIAFSRLTVSDDALTNGLKKDTKYTLSNAYAANYWIPMRTDQVIYIKNLKTLDSEYAQKKPLEQYTLF